MARQPDIEKKIIDGALAVAGAQGWPAVTLAGIAAESGVTLAELLGRFSSKGEIRAAFSRRIDRAVAAGTDAEGGGEPVRDRVFDVVMRRFEQLAPYRDGVRALTRASLTDPREAACGGRLLLRSMATMLEAAGVSSSGLAGLARVEGLTAIYLAALRVWLGDDSEDMGTTMAALDKLLNRAERLMESPLARVFCRPSTASAAEAPAAKPPPKGGKQRRRK